MEAFKSFKSTGPVVFIDSKKEGLTNAPKSVGEIRNQSHMGNTIPMVMVTTADTSKALKGFSHDDLADTRKAVRELKKEIKDIDVVGSAPAAEEDGEDAPSSTFLAEEQVWTNSEGKKITAAVISADETTVTFQMQNGKSVAYPMEKLSASSIETIQGLLEK